MDLPSGVTIGQGCTLATNEQTAHFLKCCEWTAEEVGHVVTITHGTDGQHSGAIDPHLFGFAFDVRTHDQINPHVTLGVLAQALGPEWYVFLEDAGTANEHLHAQVRKDLWRALVPETVTAGVD